MSDRYRLLMEGARYADEHGPTAVWTPERHFHRFGGLFPNPSVTGAAVAAVTSRVQVRAGSVVLPLHHPVRVAEEWAVVDNLSHGRAGVALASGWNPEDFAFDPDAYADRRERTVAAVETLRRLWRGEPIDAETERRVYPRPVQTEIPLWLTSSGNPGTFETAGRVGAGVLTNLLTQGMDALAGNVTARLRGLGPRGPRARRPDAPHLPRRGSRVGGAGPDQGQVDVCAGGGRRRIPALPHLGRPARSGVRRPSRRGAGAGSGRRRDRVPRRLRPARRRRAERSAADRRAA